MLAINLMNILSNYIRITGLFLHIYCSELLTDIKSRILFRCLIFSYHFVNIFVDNITLSAISVLMCTDNNTISNAVMNTSDILYGTIVGYTMTVGYHINGSTQFTSECTQSGRWAPEYPSSARSKYI